MTYSAFDLGILGPAFLAGLLVLATHVPLGREVLKRGIIFLDLAIAQFAALGLIVAQTFAGEPSPWSVQLIAAGAALTGALLLQWTERQWPAGQEALIGSAFVVTSSLGILLLAQDPHGGEALQNLLAGQILWVTPGQLAYTAALYAGLLLLGLRHGFSGPWFYPLFAMAVTASVQLVGIYLVFASLILPALTAGRHPGSRRLLAYGIGIAGYAGGLFISAAYDLPAGPAVVWGLALASGVAGLGAGLPGARH